MMRSLGLIAISIGLITSAVAAPTVNITPPVAPPSTTVTIDGSGFGARAAVDIYFDTVDTCLAIATTAGAISCAIKIPRDSQPQRHWISAVQRGTFVGAQRPVTVRTDMAQFHGRDAAHAGVNPYENTLNAGNAGDLDTLWSVRFHPWGTNGSPIVYGGKVYVRGLIGKLFAFDAATGANVPGFPVTVDSTAGLSSPAAGYGRVFVGGSDSKLYAFDAATGALASGFPKALGGSAESTPALALGNVYVGGNDWKLYAFNATTGVPVTGFPADIGGTTIASPAIAHGIVTIGAHDNNIHAFDALTGAAIPGYLIGTGDTVNGTVAIASGMGFAGANDHKLYGFRAATGVAMSGFPVTTGLAVASTPAISGGKVYFGSDDGVFSALYSDGSTAWSRTLDGLARGSPMVANGVVYTSSLNRVYALSAATGSVLWSAAVPLGELNSPVVADGVVYYASNDGYLYAFSLNGLQPARRLPGGAAGVVPALSSLRPDTSLKARPTE